MLFFDGINRSCVKYVKKAGVGLRCVEFEAGKKSPDCPSKSNKSYKLKGGGRSQNYIRANNQCAETGGPMKRRRAAKKPSRKSSKK